MDKKLKNTVLFFIFTFIWTWAFYFAIVIMKLNPYQWPGMLLIICGGCAPTLIGLIMMLATYQKEEKREYLKRIWQARRIGARWWLFIVLVFPAIFAVSIILNLLTGGAAPGITNLKAVIANPLSFFPLILLSFMSGPFSEEFGWRGFALTPLLGRFGFTGGSLLLGLIWGLWHLPLYFMPQTWHGQMGFQAAGFPMFLLLSVGLSVLMSFVFVHTKSSILSALLMHLLSNFTAQLLSPYPNSIEVFRSVLVWVLAVVLCVYMTLEQKNSADTYRPAA